MQLRALASALVLLATPVSFAAAPADAGTATPRQRSVRALADELLVRIERGNAAELDAFVDAHLEATAAFPRSIGNVKRTLRNLHARGARATELSFVRPEELDVTLHGREGAVVDLVLRESAKHPGQLDRFRFFAQPSPPDLSALAPGSKARPLNARLAVIDRTVKALAQKDAFSGVVLIAKGDRTLLQTAVGFADRNASVRNTVDTRFNLASMGKLFTIVSIAQLVEAGKVDLAAPLIRYVPDYPNPEVAKKVTIRQLLTHTSGLGSYFGPTFSAHRDDVDALADYLPFYATEPLVFAPGSDWSYSNAGMLTLGLVVERVTGQSWFDYVQAHIYEPAGMSRTGSPRSTEISPGTAVGYTHMSTEDPLAPMPPWTSNVLSLPRRGGAAGGGYSTAPDLLRFVRALAHEKLLGKETFARFITPQVEAKLPGLWSGLGFEVTPTGVSPKSYGHGGMYEGTNTDLRVYPEQDLTVIVLSNQDPMAATMLSDAIGKLLTSP